MKVYKIIQNCSLLKVRQMPLFITTETFFLKIHTQNVVEKLVQDPYMTNWNWAYLWINSLKFCIICFYRIPSWGLLGYIEANLQSACFYLILSFFKKWKKSLELVSLPYFLYIFLRKIFLCLYSINWPNFIAWLSLPQEVLCNMSIAIVCDQVVTSWIF